MANCDEQISVYKCTKYCTSAMGERTSTKSFFKFGYIKSTLAKDVFEYHAFICKALIKNLPNKVLVPALLTEFDDIMEDLLGVCVAALLLPTCSVSLVRFLHCFYPFIFASVFIQIEPFILILGGYQQVIRTRKTKTKVKVVTHLITPVFIVDLLVDDVTSKKCMAIARKIVLCCWTWNCRSNLFSFADVILFINVNPPTFECPCMQ